ncbi:hypothetical protein [Legionella maceachernii]|uniref:Secreted protein n=1 Tax=Legionella maceachernii TaxID=466 RepID=A0A0W0WBU9_9GAMM|nr:hypothetical protein [Legionella maceachernii]KTD29715.1 hypothetical protein Lmac_0890 [Legionella maceachernii]SKA31007.1 hypothetical protein SAMN02745128_03245 [Legionella maceachernii]SUP04212.1 Uncharacterised protein [Legionella maceachernii]
MKIKSTVAGLVVAATMLAVGPSQAAVCTTSTCGAWAVPASFSGTGWSMVPCGAVIQPAVTWQQYTSGRYAPPVTGRNTIFLGL